MRIVKNLTQRKVETLVKSVTNAVDSVYVLFVPVGSDSITTADNKTFTVKKG